MTETRAQWDERHADAEYQRITRDRLAQALVDDDQGVCPAGHDCHLVTTPRGTIERVCYFDHPDMPGVVEGPYAGMPLIRWGVTDEQVAEAEAAGVDRDLCAWAISTIADRKPAVELYDGNTRINIVVDGLDIDLIRRETGELFVSFAAVERSQQAVLDHTHIDAYRFTAPDMTVRLADRRTF